jgi:hypothetical protein
MSDHASICDLIEPVGAAVRLEDGSLTSRLSLSTSTSQDLCWF